MPNTIPQCCQTRTDKIPIVRTMGYPLLLMKIMTPSTVTAQVMMELAFERKYLRMKNVKEVAVIRTTILKKTWKTVSLRMLKQTKTLGMPVMRTTTRQTKTPGMPAMRMMAGKTL